MKFYRWLILPLILFFCGCFVQTREAGINNADFADYQSGQVTYRLHYQDNRFVPGEKLNFVFSIINESDEELSFNLRDRRFIYLFLKNSSNETIYKERILSDRFFKEEILRVAPQSTVKYNISVQPEKSLTDTISSIYCNAQLILLPKGLDYNRLSFVIKRK